MKKFFYELGAMGFIIITIFVILMLAWLVSMLSPAVMLAWLGNNWVALLVGAGLYAVATKIAEWFSNRKK